MSAPRLEALRRAGLLAAVDVHLARWLLRAGASETTALAGALASRAVRAGHVCVDLRGCQGLVLDEEATPLPSRATWPDWTELEADPFVGQEGASDAAGCPLVRCGPRLYLARYHDHECALAAGLRALSKPVLVDEGALDDGLHKLFDAGDVYDDQRAACRVASSRRLTVVSGGPGTGKTHTVARLVALLAQQRRRRGLSCRVRLLAPTGKAAARLLEALQKQELPSPFGDDPPERASTIQRALGSIGGSRTRFRHGRRNPLPDDVVVVDEASMVDLALMRRLVDAVRPDAHLVLLGDRHQLASVESGAVLGEIVAAAEAEAEGPVGRSVALLRHSFRFRGAIGQLAEAVRLGRVEEALAVLKAGGDVSWIDRPAPHRGLTGPLGDVVASGYRPLLRADTPAAALEALSRFRVLCAHRRGPWGVHTINSAIEQRLAPLGLAPSAEWYARRPVMVTANDYRQELFNGDQGVTMPGPQGMRVTMAGEGARNLAPARLANVETVFALSIHKSQGSEYDHVVVLLPEPASPLLSRELLYTAITRAKGRVTVVGGEQELAVAIGRPLSRMSGLAERLTR